MITLEHDQLTFRFPSIHPWAVLSIGFERTCRIPDDGREYRLPGSLGRIPLRHVDDFADQLDEQARRRAGVMLPMHASEAMWISMSHSSAIAYPMAVKVAAGKVNALTGKAWTPQLRDDPQDYMVVPPQPWLDGFAVAEGCIRQFVAERLGDGYSVEEQVTGKAEFGGLQLIAYPMKPEVFQARIWEPELKRRELRDLLDRAFEDVNERARLADRSRETLSHIRHFIQGWSADGILEDTDWLSALSAVHNRLEDQIRKIEQFPDSAHSHAMRLCETAYCAFDALPQKRPQQMGMAAGGRMRQPVYEDRYGIDSWDQTAGSRCFVTLLDAASWQSITGTAPPSTGLSAKDYADAGLPWFDFYAPGEKPLPGSSLLAKVKGPESLKSANDQNLDRPLVDPIFPVPEEFAEGWGTVVREPDL